MIKITIQEVANNFSLSKDTLRYYEKEGLIDPVKKNKSGIREYTAEDLKRIEFIKCMRSAGLSISVLKEYIKLYNEGVKTQDLRINLLERERISLKIIKLTIVIISKVVALPICVSIFSKLVRKSFNIVVCSISNML